MHQYTVGVDCAFSGQRFSKTTDASGRRWNSLTAVKRGNLYFIPPQEIQRHTPRLLDGAEDKALALVAELVGQVEQV